MNSPTQLRLERRLAMRLFALSILLCALASPKAKAQETARPADLPADPKIAAALKQISCCTHSS